MHDRDTVHHDGGDRLVDLLIPESDDALGSVQVILYGQHGHHGGHTFSKRELLLVMLCFAISTNHELQRNCSVQFSSVQFSSVQLVAQCIITFSPLLPC